MCPSPHDSPFSAVYLIRAGCAYGANEGGNNNGGRLGFWRSLRSRWTPAKSSTRTIGFPLDPAYSMSMSPWQNWSVPPSNLGTVLHHLWFFGGIRIGSQLLICLLQGTGHRHQTYVCIPEYRRRHPCFPRVGGSLFRPVSSVEIFLSLLIPLFDPLELF